jgi:transposase InsO family protein
MASLHHANARTTQRIRKEIQNSQESIEKLAQRYGINFKTVLKWKHRDFVEDLPSGQKTRRSVLSEVEQQALCTVRRHTQLPLDDLLAVMKPRIPALTRSNLHRCLQHHDLSRLPKADDSESVHEKKAFKAYPVGYVHIDITTLHHAQGKAYLFVAIDRTTKYVYAELYESMTSENAVLFLGNFLKHYVIKVTHILTDNGAQFTYKLLAPHLQPKDGKVHPFDALCQAHGIEHRLTKFHHPWTNGQVEVFNKTVKQATVKVFHYENLDALKVHLMAFLLYYNHQRPLKALKLKSPWQFIENVYNEFPALFLLNPLQFVVGLNNYGRY